MLIGSEDGNRWIGGFERQLFASVLSTLVSQRLQPFLPAGNYHDLLAMKYLIGAAKVTRAVDRVYPLPGAADATRYVHCGKAQSRVIITI